MAATAPHAWMRTASTSVGPRRTLGPPADVPSMHGSQLHSACFHCVGWPAALEPNAGGAAGFIDCAAPAAAADGLLAGAVAAARAAASNRGSSPSGTILGCMLARGRGGEAQALRSARTQTGDLHPCANSAARVAMLRPCGWSSEMSQRGWPATTRRSSAHAEQRQVCGRSTGATRAYYRP